MDRNTIITKLNKGTAFIFTKSFSMDYFDEKWRLIGESDTPDVHFFETNYKNLVVGDFRRYIEFIHPNGHKDYLMFSANSCYAWPQQVAIGTEVNGEVHLIREICPQTQGELSIIKLPNQRDIYKSPGFTPHSVIYSFSPAYKAANQTRNPNSYHLCLGIDMINDDDVGYIEEALGAKRRIKSYFESLK